MSIEVGIWRIDQGVQPVRFEPIDNEKRLEALLESHIEIVEPGLMVIGRQVRTTFDKYVDLLGMDVQGNLAVVELKRDRTYRDIVSQVLDYGSWVQTLRDEELARIYREYVQKYRPDRGRESINDGFCRHFGVRSMPEELNSEHRLVIVASSLDPSTERIVTYLAEHSELEINAVFLRFFRDGDREFLSRAWLLDPANVSTDLERPGGASEWNGEFYVTFGLEPHRDWTEARNYGFISAGGGWWGEQLAALHPGDRVWVMVPGRGYVGVGRVVEDRVPVEEFMVDNGQGGRVSITELPLQVATAAKSTDFPDTAEYLVRVDWAHTVPLEEAVRERGFFANQNIVARPRSSSWPFTVGRLKERFGVD